jgi:hypothetical protein
VEGHVKLQHKFALKSSATRDLITYQGRVIVHNNERELAFLFGLGQGKNPSLSVVEISARFVSERPTVRLAAHPDMAGVTFPLDPDEFRDRRK